MADTVTITKKEYESLLAAAELVKHPEVVARTILAKREARSVAFNEAFPEDATEDVATELESLAETAAEIREADTSRLRTAKG